MTDHDQTADKALSILGGFMEVFGLEVEARGREELTEAQKDELRKLAAGELDEDERQVLIMLLATNEVAMEFLAKEAG